MIAVPGLWSLPADKAAWTDHVAVAAPQLRARLRVVKFEYFAGVVLGKLAHWPRVWALARAIRRERHAGRQVIIVAHSNGCRIAHDAALAAKTFVARIAFVAGANDADFVKNGLNDALALDWIGEVLVFMSRRDGTLALARKTAPLLERVGLAYHWLGLTGPENVSPLVADRVRVFEKRVGHSYWLTGPELETTLRVVLAEPPAPPNGL